MKFSIYCRLRRALLIVDAAQSIQAQTIQIYIALENDLEIIPVLNKVDLPSANPEEVSDDIVDLLGCKLEDIIMRRENWFRCRKYLAAVIENSASKGNVDEPLQALILTPLQSISWN
jgi:GTP-binding protein LepA